MTIQDTQYPQSVKRPVSPIDTRGIDPGRRYTFAELARYEGQCRNCGIVGVKVNVSHPCQRCGSTVQITRTIRKSQTQLDRWRQKYFANGGVRNGKWIGLRVFDDCRSETTGEWFLIAHAKRRDRVGKRSLREN